MIPHLQVMRAQRASRMEDRDWWSWHPSCWIYLEDKYKYGSKALRIRCKVGGPLVCVHAGKIFECETISVTYNGFRDRHIRPLCHLSWKPLKGHWCPYFVEAAFQRLGLACRSEALIFQFLIYRRLVIKVFRRSDWVSAIVSKNSFRGIRYSYFIDPKACSENAKELSFLDLERKFYMK